MHTAKAIATIAALILPTAAVALVNRNLFNQMKRLTEDLAQTRYDQGWADAWQESTGRGSVTAINGRPRRSRVGIRN